MKVAVLGFCIFMSGFLVHWLLWQFRVPANAITSLLSVFFLVLVAGFAATRYVPFLSAFSPCNVWEYLHVTLFHVSLTLGYIIVYSAIEEDSPSTTMVKFTALAGDSGRSRSEFNLIVNNDLLIEARLRAMVQGGLAVRNFGRIQLTPQGFFWLRILSFWSRLLGIHKGG